MHTTRHPVVATLLEATPPLSGVIDLTAMLDSIVRALATLAPETQVGICAINGAGTCETLAGTHRLAFALDNIQCHLDEGPGLTVIREDHTVIVDDAESEHRWPSFMPYAVDLGLRSYLGVSLSVEDTTLGALNLYSTTHRRLDAERLSLAKLFAAQAAAAMRQTQREDNLVLALQTSRTIGKAIGLVMERFDLDEEDAFDYLARLSHNTNIKLRDLAAHFVTQSNNLRHVQAAKRMGDEPPFPNPTGAADAQWMFPDQFVRLSGTSATEPMPARTTPGPTVPRRSGPQTDLRRSYASSSSRGRVSSRR